MNIKKDSYDTCGPFGMLTNDRKVDLESFEKIGNQISQIKKKEPKGSGFHLYNENIIECQLCGGKFESKYKSVSTQTEKLTPEYLNNCTISKTKKKSKLSTL